MKTRHWLLWDETCDLCRKAAMWLAARDTQGSFTIVPYQEAPAPPMTPALRVQAGKALQVVTRDGRRLDGGEAVLFALLQTGWHPGVVGLLIRRPFLWGVEVGYRVVARNRSRINRFVRNPQ